MRVKRENKSTLSQTLPEIPITQSHKFIVLTVSKGRRKRKPIPRTQVNLYGKVMSIITCGKRPILVFLKSVHTAKDGPKCAISLPEQRLES